MPKEQKKKRAKKRKAKAPVYIGLDEDGNPPEWEYAEPARSSIHNNGLFAAKAIPKDAYVIQYLGERIRKKESNDRGIAQYDKSTKEDTGSVYIFEIDDKYDIDGNFDWNIARLANHSCSPNCEAQDIDGEIWLVALKRIKKGDELTFDYGYALEHWEDHPCLCGSKNCIGYIVRKQDRSKLKKILAKREAQKTDVVAS